MSLRRACTWLGLAVGLAVGLAGCRSSRPAAPDPAACETEADCASGPLVDPGDVCCDSGVHLGVFSRAYLDWRAQVRKSECERHACAAQPSPALPRPCATQPRCVARRCVDSCTPP